MAAYASLVSLMRIIHQIENHPSPPISLDKQQVDSLTQVVTGLQEFLEGYVSPYGYSDEADPLEFRIANAAYAAEDVIESYIVVSIPHAVGIIHDYGDYGSDDRNYGSSRGGSRGELGEAPAPPPEKRTFRSYILQPPLGSSDDDDDDDEVMDSYYKMDNIQLAAAVHDEREQIRYINFYQGLQKIIEAMELIKKDMLPRNVSVDVASKSSSTESTSTMVGFEDELLHLKERLVGGY